MVWLNMLANQHSLSYHTLECCYWHDSSTGDKQYNYRHIFYALLIAFEAQFG